MKIVIQKLGSRKFWVVAATVISGILMMFGYGETVIEVVSGAVLVIGGTVIYVITEGKIDAERIRQATNAVIDIVETVVGENE